MRTAQATFIAGLVILAGYALLFLISAIRGSGSLSGYFSDFESLRFWARCFMNGFCCALLAGLFVRGGQSSGLSKFAPGLLFWFILHGQGFVLGIFMGYGLTGLLSQLVLAGAAAIAGMFAIKSLKGQA